METYTYHCYTYERGRLYTLLVDPVALAEADSVNDFIAHPDDIINLSFDGVVDIESPVMLPECMEG